MRLCLKFNKNINTNLAVVNIAGDGSGLLRNLGLARSTLVNWGTVAANIGCRLQAIGCIITESFADAARVFANFDMQMRTVKAVTSKVVKELEESLTPAQQPSN